MDTNTQRAYGVLAGSTFAFTICFAVWMIFAVLGIPISKELQLSETQFGLLAAMPVLTGSLVRVPLGMLTDRFGGRIIFFLCMLLAVVPVYLIAYATAYWQFLILALFVGLVGGTFSVGTPYVAKWFKPERQGLAMGIFGAGNAGSALTKLAAPLLIVAAAGAWTIVPKVYAAVLLGTALLFWLMTSTNPAHNTGKGVPLKAQLATLKDPRVWQYCQFYSVVFGGYVALALWMTHYYIDEFGFSMQSAALLAACFSLPGGVLRALGGWLSDRKGAFITTWWVMWVCCIAFFFLSYPNIEYKVQGVQGEIQFQLAHSATSFTVLLFIIGIAMAVGKASVFKFIAQDFPEKMGAVSGVVGLVGGLAGFVLPILFGLLVDLTGVRSSVFMLMFGTVCVSLLWMVHSNRQGQAAWPSAEQGENKAA